MFSIFNMGGDISYEKPEAEATQKKLTMSVDPVKTEDTLCELCNDLEQMSNFAYRFRTLRDIVRDRDLTVGDGRGSHKDKKVRGVDAKEEGMTYVKFVRPDLIITDMGNSKKHSNFNKKTLFNRNFQYEVAPSDILKFMELNRKYLKMGESDLEFDEEMKEKSEPLALEKSLAAVFKDEKIKIKDYDDSFSSDSGGLVYGLIANVSDKRVTIVFRGTIGLTDALTDRDFQFNHDLYKHAYTTGKKIGVHSGFSQYLHKPREFDERKQQHRSNMDRIIAALDDIYQFDDEIDESFELCTTGHSLGGGLANLFAFHVADLKSKDDRRVKRFPKKVTAVTFAAPVIGNYELDEHYLELEKKGFLRHLRFSNEGDIVPTNRIAIPFAMKGNPPLPFFSNNGSTWQYKQNGLNIFFRKNGEMEIRHNVTHSFLSQVGMNSAEYHYLTEYEKRMRTKENQLLLASTSVEELYAEHFTGEQVVEKACWIF